MSRKIKLFHTLLGKKPPTIFNSFSISHQTYTTKSPSLQIGNWTITAATQNQPYSKIREEYHVRPTITHETHIPVQRKRSEIMKMADIMETI